MQVGWVVLNRANGENRKRNPRGHLTKYVMVIRTGLATLRQGSN